MRGRYVMRFEGEAPAIGYVAVPRTHNGVANMRKHLVSVMPAQAGIQWLVGIADFQRSPE